MAKDHAIYSSLDIYSQEFVYGEEKEGDLPRIQLVVKEDEICSAADTKVILEGYLSLSEAIKSNELKSPIIFTNTGGEPRIGIVPELEV
jgi:hypothetical protein